MEFLSTEYDESLKTVVHYRKYPEMLPWVGCDFSTQKIKILLIGESHYLDKDSVYHHDQKAWYDGIVISDKKDWGWVKTRNIISNGIKSNWKSRSKTIYRNTENALFESNLFVEKPITAYSHVAFMNFFQRPAEKTGKSIEVSDIDQVTSNEVFQSVVNVISPDAVIFTSSLAFKCARNGKSLGFLKSKKIIYARTPHPGMPWWNRVSRAYENKTGKAHFIDFINKQVQDKNA